MKRSQSNKLTDFLTSNKKSNQSNRNLYFSLIFFSPLKLKRIEIGKVILSL